MRKIKKKEFKGDWGNHESMLAERILIIVITTVAIMTAVSYILG